MIKMTPELFDRWASAYRDADAPTRVWLTIWLYDHIEPVRRHARPLADILADYYARQDG